MDGEPRQFHPRPARPGLRQALLAIVASAVVVGGIAVASNGDAATTTLLPGSTYVEVTTTVPFAESPLASASLDIGTSESATTATSTTATSTIATSTIATALVSTPTAVPATPVATDVPSTLPATTAVATKAAVAPVGLPAIDARAFAVYDVASATWLAESQADAPLPVGSVMKLLTSYVVLQAGDLDKIVTVPALQVAASESAIGLYQGEQLPRDVLFRAMLIVSANDAARTLAIDVGGSTEAFVAAMNAAAARLGLSNTIAANPIGLDAAGAHSSARDMVSLATVLMQDDTFRQAVAKTSASLHKQTFSATNRLLTAYPGADGIKTGHTTDAGYCLVGSATRNGRTVIVAVLGASSDDRRLAGATALLDWAFAQ